MQIFISYRRSRDSTDRILRQLFEYLQTSIDIRRQYRNPLFKDGNSYSLPADAVLDLRLAHASKSAATLIIALTGARGTKDFDYSRFPTLLEQADIVDNILSSGRNHLTSWRDFGQRPVKHIYRNFLSIGMGNAIRTTLAIKRLLLLRSPDFLPPPDRRGIIFDSSASDSSRDQLFLQELQSNPALDRESMVSSAVAGIAVLTDDHGPSSPSSTAHIWDPAHVFRTPAGEEITWIFPSSSAAPLGGFQETSSPTHHASVDELSASIVLENFNALSESHFLALQEGIIDRGKDSRLSRFNRLLRVKIRSVTNNTIPKLRKYSKGHILKSAHRNAVVRSAEKLTLFDLYKGDAGEQSFFDARFASYVSDLLGKKEFLTGSSASQFQEPGTIISLYRGDLPYSGNVEVGDAEAAASEDLFHPQPFDADPGSSVCGSYVTYRYEFDGKDTSRVFREVLHVRHDQNRLFFSMSIFDRDSAGSEFGRTCEGEVSHTDGALLLVEKHKERGNPTRIVCMFLDEEDEDDIFLNCRVSATADIRGPGKRRVGTACTLLVRIHWSPLNTKEFMEQAARVGAFDEIIRADFGNDESDLDYIRDLLQKAEVGENAKARIIRGVDPRGAPEPCSDLDLQPFECGMDNIIARALADRAIMAPFKPGWSERPGATGNAKSRSRSTKDGEGR